MLGIGRDPGVALGHTPQWVTVYEQYWQLGGLTCTLAPNEERTIGFVREAGRLDSTTDQQQLTTSLLASASGSASWGWGSLSLSLSASLNSSQSTSHTTTVTTKSVSSIEQTLKNPHADPVTILEWQLIDRIAVLSAKGDPNDGHRVGPVRQRDADVSPWPHARDYRSAVKIVSWNIEHSSTDSQGWLFEDLEGIAHSESPELIALCEAQLQLSETIRARPPPGYVVPAEPIGYAGAGYRADTTLRYLVLVKQGAQNYRHCLVGSAFSTVDPTRLLARRPGLSIRWNDRSFLLMHPPAATDAVRPQAEAVADAVVGAERAWELVDPVDFIFGDLNVDQGNAVRLQQFRVLLAPATGSLYEPVSPGAPTH